MMRMAATRISTAKYARILLSLVILLFLTALACYSPFGSPNLDATAVAEAQAHQPDGPRFAILCMTSSETSYDYISFSNKHKYASKHGYDLIWDFDPTRDWLKVWDKLNISRDAITASLSGQRAYEWVWMLDFDTLITNSSIRLEDVVEQSLSFAESEGKARGDVDLILTRDCEPLNLGSFFVRA